MTTIRIALIICTRNNTQKLKVTLQKLAEHVPKSIQIILVDQSAENYQRSIPPSLNCVYVWTPKEKGLSRARNRALQHTRADVLAWTDDDCIITAQYVKQLQHIGTLAATAKKKKLAGVCGRTLAYLPTQPSPRHYCPSTFTKDSKDAGDTVLAHWRDIGFGNNMVLFRYIFDELGLFKEWLGAGSVGDSGEDGEFMIRCHLHKLRFLYNTDLLVYHNKWLDESHRQQQNWRYTCGGLASYGYFYFQGISACRAEFWQNLAESKSAVWTYLRRMKHVPPRLSNPLWSISNELYFCGKGILLALIYSKLSLISRKNVSQTK